MTLELFDVWVAARKREYVCVCTVHGIMECQRSSDLKAIFNQAGMVTPDGMPLVWLLRHARYMEASRVYGPDLMLAELARSASTSRSHFFYGGQPGVAEKLKSIVEARFSGLRVVGAISPPVGTAEELATQEIADSINQARPDVVWVGLGCPKQERWMAAMRPRLEAPILVGVGAAFDFHAGLTRQAPRWMMGAGLEWLFRLVIDPRRLWRRYLLYNPWFAWSVALQLVGLRKHTQHT